MKPFTYKLGSPEAMKMERHDLEKSERNAQRMAFADHVYAASEKEPDQHAEAIEAIELQEHLDERNQ